MRVSWTPRGMPCCTLNLAASHSPCVPVPPPEAAIISSLTSPPSRKPRRADAEHSFIVTVMKPVVHVPWYQVLLWILSAGADCLLAPAAILVAPCEALP